MSDRREDPVRDALEAVAARVGAASRLEPPAGEAVLRSVVEATVALFDAEAASIALHDPATDRLVIRVAAGPAGEGAVGVAFSASEGIAGYTFTTGQPIAVSDTSSDPRFDRSTAERTGYVPRSILAVPMVDDQGTIGVLEVLDKRGTGGFGLRDLELASVFARQAAVAIRASRVERDTAALLRAVLGRLAGAAPGGAEAGGVAPGGAEAGGAEAREAAPGGAEAVAGGSARGSAGGDAAVAEVALDALDQAVAEAVAALDTDGDDRLWALADAVARARHAAPDQVALVIEILDALARRAARPGHRPFRR